MGLDAQFRRVEDVVRGTEAQLDLPHKMGGPDYQVAQHAEALVIKLNAGTLERVGRNLSQQESYAAALGQEIADLLKRPTSLILDITAVNNISEAGVGMFITIRTSQVAQGQKLALVILPTSDTAEQLQILGIGKLIPVFPSVEEALTGIAKA